MLAERAAKLKLVTPGTKMNKPLAGCTLSSECQDTEVCHAGTCASTVSIKVEEFSTSAKTIDVDVKKKGQKAAILVDQNDTVAAADIDAMLKTFEETIYQRDVGLYDQVLGQLQVIVDPIDRIDHPLDRGKHIEGAIGRQAFDTRHPIQPLDHIVMALFELHQHLADASLRAVQRRLGRVL